MSPRPWYRCCTRATSSSWTAAHKVASAQDAIEAAGARLLYLPSYSPDFSPIEQVFAKLKALLRSAAARTIPDVWAAICQAFTRFTPQECRDYLAAAGDENDSAVQIRCTARNEIPTALATARPVQCVTSPGDSEQVRASTLATVSVEWVGVPGGRVLSRSKPSTPASASRRCQRHTAVRLKPTRRAKFWTLRRSAESKTMRARWICLSGRQRSLAIAASRAASLASRRTHTV